MVIRSLTEDCKNGFYVEVGAHHPVYFSNTYHFYSKGWRGINIDATPGSMTDFLILRSKDINLELCLGPEKDVPVEFFIFDRGAFNTFDEQMAERALSSGEVELIEKRTLQTTTLKECLDKYVPENIEIDLMSIDVEGLDEAILMSNDWSRYKPKVLVFEKHDVPLNKLDELPIMKFLSSLGYELVAKCGPSLILKL